MLAASTAATAGGTVMQANSQKKAQRKIDEATRLNAQLASDKQEASQKLVLDQTDQFSKENFEETQNVETEKLQKGFAEVLQPGNVAGSFSGGDVSANTQRLLDDKSREGNTFSHGLADSLAKLRGFGAGLDVNTRDTRRAGEQIALNQNETAGNNALLGIQIADAQRGAANPLADIMVGVGSAGMQAGLSAPVGGGNTTLPSGMTKPIARPTGFQLA